MSSCQHDYDETNYQEGHTNQQIQHRVVRRERNMKELSDVLHFDRQ